jgi:hypothetical protein
LSLTPLIGELLVELFGVGNFVIITHSAVIPKTISIVGCVDVKLLLVEVLFGEDF